MNAQQLIASRRDKDAFMKDHPQSPLSPEQQAAFDALPYYDYHPALDLTVRVEPVEGEHEIAIETSSGDVRRYERFGRFTFTVDGHAVTLTIYEAPHGYFLPFRRRQRWRRNLRRRALPRTGRTCGRSVPRRFQSGV